MVAVLVPFPHPRVPVAKVSTPTTSTYSDERGSSRSHSRAGRGLPSQLASLPHLGQELFRAEIGF